MSVRLPSIDSLLALEASLRLGSMDRAGEALSISASAIAKRLSALEELLGTPLVQRGGKPLLPTAAGKEYLAEIAPLLERLAAVGLHQRAAQRRTRLRVTAPPTFARGVLVPALPAFASARPDIELELQLSTPYLDEPAPDAEATIRHGRPGRDFERDWQLTQDTVTPVAAPALLAGRFSGITDLAALPLLRTPIEPWTPWLRAAGLDWPEPDQGPRFIDLGLTLEAALLGHGVALARSSLAEAALRSGALVRLSELNVPASGQYGIGFDATNTAAADFAHWLRERCRAAG